MQTRKPRISVVEPQANYGIYIWRCSSGKVFGDGQGNIMNIAGRPHDIEAMAKLRDAAKAFGVEEGGKPEFWPACRPVSDMEASEQKDRMRQGYIPSETDLGAWADAEKAYKVQGHNDYEN